MTSIILSVIITKTKNPTGFTIVELLVVIVVIAILATVSVVSFNGIQQRAREVQLSSDIDGIKKGMELYRIDKGKYPSCISGGDCWYDDIKPQLSPKYVSEVGTEHFGYAYYSSMPDTWAMEYAAGDPPYKVPYTCKFGVNVPPGWYSGAPMCK